MTTTPNKPPLTSVRDPLVVSWAVLVLLTLISVVLGADHAAGGMGPRVATVAVLVIAFAKAAVVAMNFMEVKTAPNHLRLAFATVLTSSLIVTLTLYLWL
ncbi:cytochrome C oxidase subunit IV family protein [Mycobacterium sp. NPDC003449]